MQGGSAKVGLLGGFGNLFAQHFYTNLKTHIAESRREALLNVASEIYMQPATNPFTEDLIWAGL
jgi:hypothetical protein